jgi:hypothetical protein
MGLFKKAEPKMMEVNGYQIKCVVCANEYFHAREGQLNTSAASFFNLDWANKSATCLVCSECTHIMWFLGN